MKHSYYTNDLYCYLFEDTEGMEKMQLIVKMFRYGFKTIGGLEVEQVLDYSCGIGGLPESGVIEYLLAGGSAVILKPFGSESKLNVYISIAGDTEQDAEAMKERICEDLENIIYMDGRMGYCCE